MTPLRLRIAGALAGLLLPFAASLAQDTASAPASPPSPHRPRILGVSHIGLWVKDVQATRAFYSGYLGLAEPYTLKAKDGGIHLTWMKVNDLQTVELFPISDKTPKDGDSLYHIAFLTDDAQGMRDYLVTRGVRGPGGKELAAVIRPGQIGNLGFFVEDPDGHIVEFVQYMPNGWTVQNRGKFMPDTRISSRISHVGVSVGNLDAAMRFYGDILGFTEFWRGSSDGKTLSWVNVRVPDGNDYLEIMLYGAKPSVERLHTLNHMCLEVSAIRPVEATLASRALPAGCKPTSPMKTGVNGKRQINCYDPDGTRVEVMEAATADGKPVPPSKAPPPTPSTAG